MVYTTPSSPFDIIEDVVKLKVNQMRINYHITLDINRFFGNVNNIFFNVMGYIQIHYGKFRYFHLKLSLC